MDNSSSSSSVPVIYISKLTPEQAQKLSDFLPVNLRDFWLGVSPEVQAYLAKLAHSREEFFTLIQMEAARFQQIKRTSYNRPAWYEPAIGKLDSTEVPVLPMPVMPIIKENK